MRTRKVVALAVSATVAVSASLAVAAPPQALAKDGSPAVTTDAALLAHAEKVAPLNEVANALGEQGRGGFADSYSGLYVDEDQGSVTLYATDVARAAELIAAARQAHTSMDAGRIQVRQAAYTRAALDAELDRILPLGPVTTASDTGIYTAAARSDGSGIEVTADSATVARLRGSAATSGGIPVTHTVGTPVQPRSWRWNDTRPQIGGDVLIGRSHGSGEMGQCTSAFAAEDAGGRDYLVTAAHCFPTGAAVYGEGGAQPGHWTYTPGNHFGNISAMRDGWDAELIDSFRYNGAGFNSDEADTPAGKWYPVNSYAYSYAGQTVCQDGARSYYNGRGVPCGIKVTNADLRYQLVWADNTVHNVRGVRGTAGYAGTDGDSGALVFAVTDSTHRQARGVHSAGTTASDIIWTEAPDILNAFNLKLNPHQ